MPAPEPRSEIKLLYRRAFEQYGSVALWNMRPVEDPESRRCAGDHPGTPDSWSYGRTAIGRTH